ncbi:hypothetical protein EDB86DRAFT_2918688, partial [Lactarius hatsudake]
TSRCHNAWPRSTDCESSFTRETPGKALQKARSILQENALQGLRTVKTHKVPLQLQSPGGSPRKPPKDVQSSKSTKLIARPLGDKTPFINRQRRVIFDPTLGPTKGKPPAQDAYLGSITPGHALLPSSARKSRAAFETPVAKGNHWDVIEDDIEAEDCDEIEYMLPTAIDPPYTPHFDVPDYGLVGAQHFNMMHSFPKDDATDRFYAAEKEGIDETGLLEASGVVDSPSQWNFFRLPEDDDPSPFSKVRGLSAASKQSVRVNTTTIRTVPPSRPRAATTSAPRQMKQPAPSTSKRSQASQRASRVLPARPATAAGRVISTLRTAPAPMTSRIPTRPATSASLRPPTGVKSAARQTTNTRAGEMVPSTKSEFALEFDWVDDAAEDFMFDV